MSGAELSVFATLGAALITGIFLYIVRKTKPAAAPPEAVSIQDLFDENRKLRSELNELRNVVDKLVLDRDEQREINAIMGAGFDALSAYVQRNSEATSTVPNLSAQERSAVDKARHLREADFDNHVGKTHPHK